MLLDEQTVPKYRFNVVEKVMKKYDNYNNGSPSSDNYNGNDYDSDKMINNKQA